MPRQRSAPSAPPPRALPPGARAGEAPALPDPIDPSGALAGLNLNLLLVLVALVERKSVALAARHVGLSASAMSHALARLRRFVADPVLVRTARGMVPTPRAQALFARISPALRQVEAALLEGKAFEPAAAQRVVRVYANDLAQLCLVAPLAARLRTSAPGVRLAVGAYRDALAQSLAEGEVDLVLGLRRDLPTLRQKALLRDRFLCVVRRGHPLASARWTLADYAALEHVMVAFRPDARGSMDRLLTEAKLDRRVVVTVSSTLAALATVAASDCVLTVASRAAAPFLDALGLVAKAPPVAPPDFELSMAWHERTSSDPLLAWVRDELVAAAKAHAALPQLGNPAAPRRRRPRLQDRSS